MLTNVLINGKPAARALRELWAKGWSDPNAKDRIGLPYRPPENEDEAARRERLNQVRDLVVDATQSVARQVGEREARLLFKLAFQKPPKGRRADDKENADLLAAYDTAIARGVPCKRAARAAADEMIVIVPEEDPESIAKRIRRLVKRRDWENALDLLWLNGMRGVSGISEWHGLFRPSHPNSDK
jgi:hypothetical protein